MVTARAIKDHFERITIIERDRLPAEPGPRKGVPQGRHVHFVLIRGRIELERLFPSLAADLEKDGAVSFDYGRGAAVFNHGKTMARFDSELIVRGCTRPLIDWHIHRYLKASPGISFLEGTTALGLVVGPDKRTVTGVRLASEGGEEVLTADLVVDAGGRQSRAGSWLTALGFDAPEETTIDSALTYACRLYAPKPDFRADWKLLSTVPRAPNQPRSGAIFPVEGNRWLVCLASMGDDHPPTDDEGFLEFARSLSIPNVYESLMAAEPLGPIYRSGSTENRLYRYERLRRFPENFVLIGDSVCALNPLYGHGITNATLGALALAEELTRQRTIRPQGGLQELGARFQKRLARLNKDVWTRATSADGAWPHTRGLKGSGSPLREAPKRALRAYADLLLETAASQPEVARLLVEVGHLLRPSYSVLSPGAMLRVLAHRIRAHQSA
ncbi:hypothetical protein WME75_42090 [Sorangium sp. So ce1014]|uniref:NAD(P)/FAD-dependent oxidoreductase n=1 Tax=Sorangium sp. So ce1014 TaxID=3133326 RepID=UPI003F60F384